MALPLETILLVEDHSALLKIVKQILEAANFTVIAATSGKQAILLETAFPGTIDLLLSDVRMRGMSGPTLAKRLKERRPQMRVMLMSGYPGGALLVLNYGWHYIEKPFVPSLLVSKIKDVLRGETREQSTNRFDTLKEPRRSFGRAPLGFQAALTSRAH
jgi:DNA-binding NtrC family response regulator